MRINHNIASMISQAYLRRYNDGEASSLQQLSTGLRINTAADDQAGFSNATRLSNQISSNSVAIRNASDGTAMLNIADGAANEMDSILQRMRELSVEGSSDTLTSTDRSYLNQEFQQLKGEIQRLSKATKYNGQTLLDGGLHSFGTLGGFSSVIHIGANTNNITDTMQITLLPVTVGALKISNLVITNHASAVNSINGIEQALLSVNHLRSSLGAYINRLTDLSPTLESQNVNLQSSESQIRDVDFATQTTEFTRQQIMAQTATSMLSQANNLPQQILALFNDK